jgi:exodeoxyribonuclease-5
MLKDYLKKLFLEHLENEPTKGQQTLFDRFLEFTHDREKAGILVVKGYAGTGKTTAVRALIRILADRGVRSVLLAPTGRAAKVLAGYTGTEAFTIHKMIYRQRSAKDGFGKFVLGFNKTHDTVFFVDEASMISNRPAENTLFGSGRLLDDLIEYVFQGRNCKLVLIGDTAQLPPVGTVISEALDTGQLGRYGYPVTEVFLEEVIRQAENSGILVNATRLRKRIAGGKVDLPLFVAGYFRDVERVSGRELFELLEDHFQGYDREDVTVIVRSNKMANKYNEGIRYQILHREEEISRDDLVMVVKNNYFWLNAGEEADFLANGDILRIERIHNTEERYGHRFAEITFSFPGREEMPTVKAKVMLDTLRLDTPSLTADQNKELFYKILEDYREEGKLSQKKAYDRVKADPYFNALQIKFAYAITCHKAQGGQWQAVFLDQGYIPKEQMNVEYLRWLYTAFTRAVNKLYLVNFPDAWFGAGE